MKKQNTGLSQGLTKYGDAEFSLFLRKAFIKSMGYTDDALQRPIIGITNTFSGYNACHRNVPDLIGAIGRGIMLAGGLPIEFPVISMHEAFSSPTSMYLRNLMAIDVEEMIRAQPMDAVVLIGGCDKTVPALLMGAISADVPSILTVTGPMTTSKHRDERLGACTDCRRYWARYRAGEIDDQEISKIGGKLAPGPGTCMVMGTASTMALMSEAMGIMLPDGATIPAVHADRLRHAEATGSKAVEIAQNNVRPTDILSKASIANAIRVLQAIGGSTNAIIHLTAIAGRLGFDIKLGEIDRIGRETPMLVDLKPTGQHYMEDLFNAGGLRRVLHEIRHLIDLDTKTVTGSSLGENLDAELVELHSDVVQPFDAPIHKGGSIRVLFGNIAPQGALIKQAASSSELLKHTGRAKVFKSLEDLARRIDDPDLDVLPSDVLVLQNAGPKGGPGMPEAGYIPIPRKLAAEGVKDMVRISDARMSGTAFGTVVLHVSPEAAIGGPLALVKDGDTIQLDVESGSVNLMIDKAEFERRKSGLTSVTGRDKRGYEGLYMKEVLQAEHGCDFNFLRKSPI